MQNSWPLPGLFLKKMDDIYENSEILNKSLKNKNESKLKQWGNLNESEKKISALLRLVEFLQQKKLKP